MRGDPWSVNQTRRGSVSQGVCAVLFIRAHPSRRPRQPHPRTHQGVRAIYDRRRSRACSRCGRRGVSDRPRRCCREQARLLRRQIIAPSCHVIAPPCHAVTSSCQITSSRHHAAAPPCHDVTLLCRHVTPSLPPCGSAALRQASVSGAHYWALTKARQLSSIRLEKPHSLSYQAMTLISLPLVLVWLASKIDDSGLWLKSIETSGRVL
jgi:hypothetical protein